MKRLLTSFLVVAIATAVAGCGKGENLVRAKGQVAKGGANFVPDPSQVLQIVFTPISPDGTPARNLYVADVDQKTGAFYAAGALKKGVPPGRYRASVELLVKKKDVLKEKFNLVDSPFVFDIKPGSPPMKIDLDTEPEPQK